MKITAAVTTATLEIQVPGWLGVIMAARSWPRAWVFRVSGSCLPWVLPYIPVPLERVALDEPPE